MSNGPSINAVENRLNELAMRVRRRMNAKIVWERLLTEREREEATNSTTMGPDIIDIWSKLRQCTEDRAIIDIAAEFRMIFPSEREYLLASIGEANSSILDRPKPEWDKELLELRWLGMVVKTIKRPAQANNVMLVLDVFQEDGWPPCIADPLPGGQNQQRVHQTIRSLNRGLRQLAFHADGEGAGYRWQVRPRV